VIKFRIRKSTPEGFHSKAQGSATGRQTCRRTLGGIAIKTPTLKGLHLRKVRQISADFADDADKSEEDLKCIKRFTAGQSKPDLLFLSAKSVASADVFCWNWAHKQCATLSG
jgi:hypothetical protein